MSAPKIRSDHEALDQIAQRFSQQAEATRQMSQELNGKMEVLRNGDWVGKAATKFYSEMDGAVLPAVQRLEKALDSAAQITKKISALMKQAEDDAAALFKGGTASGGASGGGASGGASGGGSSGGGASGGGSSGGASGGGTSGGGSSGGGSGGSGGAGGGTGTTDSVFTGGSKEKDAPANITLPKELNDGMQSAWKDSFPKGHEKEQGGILVKKPDGTVEWLRGPAGRGDSWNPNWGDVKGDELLGTGHTHPYDSGHVNVPFSTGDIEGFFRSDLNGPKMEKMMMVQSGDGQFVLARTEEFNDLVSGKSRSEIATLKAEMNKTYDDAVAAAKKNGDSFADRYNAGVKAVADKYHLLYYAGKNGNLTKQ